MASQPSQPALPRPDIRKRHLLVCAALLTAGAAANLWFLAHNCPLDLSGDEAHYWEWARRPALSYYSKGPLVAYIIAASRHFLAGWSESLVGNESLAVRLPAILLSVLTGLGIYTLGVATLRRSQLALAAAAMTAAIPIFVVGSKLMTIDAPFVCAWTWALVFLHRAMRRDAWIDWLAAGAIIAVGMLAKYTMALIFPAFGLLLLYDPSLRRLLRRPGPYATTVLGMAGLLPVILWNASHEWVSFRHVAGQAGVASGSRIDPAGILVYIGGQAAVVGPLWFVGMIWALIDVWQRPCDPGHDAHDEQSMRLLLFGAGVPWLVFLAFSPITKIQPNWPVVALPSNVILLVLWLGRRLRLPTPAGRAGAKAFIAVGVGLSVATTVLMHRSEWLMPLCARLAKDAPPWDLTPVAKYDATARLRGWRELGTAVGQVLASERVAGREPFIMTDDYQTASEIAFYCPGEPTTYCVQSAMGERLSQYDIWENPIRNRDRFVGKPCLYVGSLRPDLTRITNGRAVLMGPRPQTTVTHAVRGHPIRVWTVYPFDAFGGFQDLARFGRRY